MSPPSTPKSLGLIGLGLMGQALASRLIGAGFQVVGFDLDGNRRDQLAALGGSAAENVQEVFTSAQRCLLSLPDHTIVEAVLRSASDAVSASSIIIDMAS